MVTGSSAHQGRGSAGGDADQALVDGRVRARVGRALTLSPLPSTVLRSLSVLLPVGVRLLLRGLRVGVEDERVVAASELIRQDLAGLHLCEAVDGLLVSGGPAPAGVDGGHSFVDDHDLDGHALVLDAQAGGLRLAGIVQAT